MMLCMSLQFDIMLPTTLLAVTLATVLLHNKYESRVKKMLEEREFKTRDVVALVAAIGLAGTVVALLPGQAIMIVYLLAYSLLLFQFSYAVYPKWYTSILPPAFFVSLYVLLGDSPYWSPFVLDIFAAIFVVLISIYVNSLFTWKTTAIFGVLITAMDIIQVLLTKFTVGAFEKTIALNLPVAILVPVIPLISVSSPPFPIFPYAFSGLGLGDFFFSGLLAIQTMKRFGGKYGLITALSISVTFFFIEMVTMTYAAGYYPATVFIIIGWLIPVIWRTLFARTKSQ